MRYSILPSVVAAGSLLSAVAVCLSLATGVRAATITSTQGFLSLGDKTAEPTGNITTATVFTIADVMSSSSQTGIFSGMPSESVGSIMFNPANDTSFSFGNSVFGNFASTSITSSVGSVTVGFNVMGDWTPGTFCNDPAGCPLTGGSFPATVTLALTQTGGTNTAISASMTFTTETPEIPLPAALPLFATGLGALGMLGWRSKRRAQAAA